MDYHSQPSFSTANSRKCIERDLKKRKSRRTAFDGVTIESVCAHAPTHKLNWTHTVRSSAAVRTHLKNNTKKNERAALHAGHAPADGSRLCTEPSCRAAYSICMGLRRTSSSNIEKTLGGWAPTECLLRVTTSVEKRKTLCCSFFFVCLFLIFFLFFSLLPSSARPPISLLLGDIKCDFN